MKAIFTFLFGIILIACVQHVNGHIQREKNYDRRANIDTYMGSTDRAISIWYDHDSGSITVRNLNDLDHTEYYQVISESKGIYKCTKGMVKDDNDKEIYIIRVTSVSDDHLIWAIYHRDICLRTIATYKLHYGGGKIYVPKI